MVIFRSLHYGEKQFQRGAGTSLVWPLRAPPGYAPEMLVCFQVVEMQWKLLVRSKLQSVDLEFVHCSFHSLQLSSRQVHIGH